MDAHRRAGAGIALVAGLLISAANADAGPGIVDEQVDGNVLTARIRILGIDLADLRIEFEEVEGLEPGALGLSARRLGLWDLIALVLRLPDRLLTSIPLELPLLLRVDPGPGVSFRGVARLTLKTDLLPYLPGTRLRVFHAQGLGPFEDVTAEAGAGSYRGGAMRPDLRTSAYIVATDLRSDQTVAGRKLNRLDALIDAHSGVIAPGVLAALESSATDVRTAFEAGSYGTAVAALDGFTTAVVAASGTDIPDLWESASSAANAAGELRSQAATLRFSLLQLGGGGGALGAPGAGGSVSFGIGTTPDRGGPGGGGAVDGGGGGGDAG